MTGVDRGVDVAFVSHKDQTGKKAEFWARQSHGVEAALPSQGPASQAPARPGC